MDSSRWGGGSDASTLTVEIVRRIAELEGVGPLELEPPLYEAIDVEALRPFLDTAGDRSSRARGSVTVCYADYEIVVDDGAVFVREPDERSTED